MHPAIHRSCRRAYRLARATIHTVRVHVVRFLSSNALMQTLALLRFAGPPGVPGFEPGRFGTGRGRGGPPMPGQSPPVHPDIAQLGGDDDAHLFM